MSNVLIRGLPRLLYREIQKRAGSQNLSANQLMIRYLQQAADGDMEKEEEKAKRKDVFRRIEKLREELYEKYGPFEDSAKLIREDRDSR